MLKKIASVLLSAVMAFSAVVCLPVNLVYTVSAAQEYDKPYYCKQLSDDAKTAYDELREAVINCKKDVRVDDISIDQKDFDKVCELLVLHDPVTFNLKNIEAYEVTRSYAKFKLTYRYNKETYQKMVAANDKKVEKILGKLDGDMSTYKKIRIIHDEIIKSASYDLNAKTADTVYGALVQKKAKCDGYAKTFSYICNKAGIRNVTVIGSDLTDSESDMLHMWNKVYYNKKWYNVDVTWDDPVSELKNNKAYDYFMVSDASLAKSHKENNLSFEVPKAEDNTINYFAVNKKYIDDADNAGSYIQNKLISAAKNNSSYIMFKCKNKSDYDKVKAYVSDTNKMCGILQKVNKKANSKLLSNVYFQSFGDTQYTVKIYIFYKGKSLDDYFVNADELSRETVDLMAKYGIK